MDFQNFWFSSGATGGGGGGDPGSPIGQSLRFRGGQRLFNNSFPNNHNPNSTLSFWIKRGELGTLQTLGCIDNGVNNVFGRFQTGDTYTIITPGGTGGTSTRVFRDPSAWYHFVINNDNCWINGELQSNFTAPLLEGIQNNNRFNIGLYGANVIQHFDGYFADFYYIDGQALEPTAFGRFNANGVWVPREIDFDGNWGANGFHLDFSDPDDIGADRSGNGNDFTPNGFDTAPVGIFSNDLTCAPGNFNAASPATTAFDGDNTTFAEGTNTGDVLTFAPVPGIAYNSLEIAVRNDDQLFSLNGGANTSIANNRTTPTFVEIDSTPGTLDTLVIEGAAGEPGSLWGIRINGTTVLVDNTGADYDSMQDSPTQNWATMNPLVTYEGQIGEFGGNRSTGQRGAADGNLTLNRLSAPGGGQKYGISTHAARGRVYLELTIGTEINGGQGIALFVGDQPRQYETYYGDPNVYTFMDNGDVSRGNGSQNGTTVLASYGSMTSGDVASIALDMDNGNAWFAVNGVWQEGDPEAGTDPTLTNLNIDQDYAFLGINCGSTPDNPNINYGQQQPFLYTPPTGFEALQTQNMPAATIANGRDHFQAITGGGGNYYASQLFIDNRDVDTPDYNTTDQSGFTKPAANGFDGNLGNDTQGPATNGNWLVFRPAPSITVNTSLRIRTDRYQRIHVNQVDSGLASQDFGINNWTWVNIPITTPLTLTNLAIQGGDNTSGFLNIARFTAIEVDGEVLGGDILSVAQTTFPNGLWWIKDRANSNQHQLVDSQNISGGVTTAITCPQISPAQQTYVAPAGDSVAWCWSVDDNQTQNNDGNQTSTTMTNVAAGFSIINYAGTRSNATTIGHGLTQAPEFMLMKARSVNSENWIVYFGSNSNFLRLNTPDQQFGSVTLVQNVTDTVIQLGDNTAINGNTGTNRIYAWHSVPGYSAFGSFDGNSSTDGPFIYLGFRPAFFMWKKTTGTGNWEMRDTTRQPTNPDEFTIYANRDFSEAGPDSLQRIDILSNGVKIRNSQSNMNQGTLIYIAFAENPFQAPVTAR